MPIHHNPPSRITRSSLAAAALIFGFAAASAASAQARNPQGRAVMQACAADVRSLCSGVQPGGGRIMRCLYQNRTKVSAECKQTARDARAARSQSSGS